MRSVGTTPKMRLLWLAIPAARESDTGTARVPPRAARHAKPTLCKSTTWVAVKPGDPRFLTSENNGAGMQVSCRRAQGCTTHFTVPACELQRALRCSPLELRLNHVGGDLRFLCNVE